MTAHRFHSLRYRLLTPLLVVAVLTACGVAAASYWLGGRRTENELNERFTEISSSLSETSFPLTKPVLSLLADLTQTELLITDGDASVLRASMPLSRSRAAALERQLARWQRGESTKLITLNDQPYRGMHFQRRGPAAQDRREEEVVILFDEQQLRTTRWQIAALPLVTGLTTTILLATITLVMTGRLIGRLMHLERQVDRIATGAFDTAIAAGPDDEIGMLGDSVRRMAAQLKQLWENAHQQQGQKLLHQIAGGMAHQLRNSLTGARMAVELHAESCLAGAEQGLHVAVQQIEQSEDFVRRLLQLGAGQQDRERSAAALRCLRDVQDSSAPVAKHRRKEIHWQLEERLAGWEVADGSTFTAAVTNLVLNALEAGQRVEIDAHLEPISEPSDSESGNSEPGAAVIVQVSDDGPGVPDAIRDQLFEPFVTSKPEGLGLGLAVVRRAAEKLGGVVEYHRQDHHTTFRFTARVTAEVPS